MDGDVEALPHYVAQSAGLTGDVVSAGTVVEHFVVGASDALE